MSAKEQIKQIVDFFSKEKYLKNKTDGMAEGLMLGASLADEANERSKDSAETTLAVQEKYKEQILAHDLNPNKDPELVDLRNGNQTAGERITKFEQITEQKLAQTDDKTKLIIGATNQYARHFDFIDSRNPILTPNDSTFNQAGYGTTIQADKHLTNPIDKFYMYWAGHDGGGIRLSTAPTPLGPWSNYPDDTTPLISDNQFGTSHHISSPDAIFSPIENKFLLFYHRAYDANPIVQSTWRVESLDGINWLNPIEVLPCPKNNIWDGIERSYFKVIYSGGLFHAVYQGRNGSDDPKAHIGYAVSSDGLNFERYPEPVFKDKQFNRTTDFWDITNFQGGSPCLLDIDGTLWLFFSNGNEPRFIDAVPFDLNEVDPKPINILSPSDVKWSPDNTSVSSPWFIEYGSKLYMYYMIVENNISIASNRIGCAVMNLEVRKNG